MSTYNIFISHAWKYSDAYKKVVQWLNEAKEDGILDWKNYSVPEHDPLLDPNDKYDKSILKAELKDQIRPASIVIIISGMYAAHSSWIDFEIDTSLAYCKDIIGLKPWGQERIPVKIQDNSTEMVAWNKNSLISAIINL